MASGSHADEMTSALKPTTSKDINSTDELRTAFQWFRDNLPAQPGKYGELYQRWISHPAAKGGWSAKPWGPDDDKLLDELGGIDFGPLLADSQRFANLRGATEEMRLGAESIHNHLSDAWSGPAAQTALDTIDKLGKASSSFRDTVNQFAAALDLARSTTRDAIVHVQQSGIRPFDLPHGVDMRREQVRRIDMAMAGQPPFNHPFAPEELRQPSTVDLNAGASWEIWWSNEVITTLDAMCDSYANVVDPLRKLLTDTTTAVTNSWNALGDALKRIGGGNLDPFGVLKAMPPGTTAPSQAPEKVSVDDGQRVITAERDAQGRLNLTVDHPGAASDLTNQPQPQPAAPGPTPTSGSGGGGGVPAGGHSGGGGGSGVGGSGAGGSAQPASPGQGSMAGVQQPASSTPDQASAASPAAHPGAPGGAPASGGMPMGGGMGAGGGQGGDSERKPSRWRTQGDLFDDGASEVVPMVIGDMDPYEKGTK
jgi:hypothetical protein